MKKCKFFVLLYKNKNIVMATIKKTTATKKNPTKKSVAKPQNETKKVSKTWLAFQEIKKDPWFRIVDMKAVLK